MDFFLVLTLLGIGLVGSFFSGLFGIGGAIINYPMLLYVPTMLGLTVFTPQQVSSISMFQVLFSSLSGVLAYRRAAKKSVGKVTTVIHKGLVLYMGSSILVGSLLGAAASKYLPNQSITIVYGVLAVIAVILMLIPVKGRKEDLLSEEVHFHRLGASFSAFSVGIVSGIVGAGGAFILIPIMLTVLRIPIRVTIASSLAIVFISAIGGTTGKLVAGNLLFWPTLITVLGSIVGAPLGSRVSKRLNVGQLRKGLVIFLALMAMKIWSSIL